MLGRAENRKAPGRNNCEINAVIASYIKHVAAIKKNVECITRTLIK